VDAHKGLVVVVPRGFAVARVPEVLRAHAAWIDRAMARTSERRERAEGLALAPVPDRVELPGIGLTWALELRPSDASGVRGRVAGDTLVLSGATADREACYEAMRRAVARAARQRLPLQLGGVEAETGWHAAAVAVRRQRTRWGSCSARGSISLNESLVFLPARLVRYVLVHELAHTRRLDHSAAFWALVEAHDAQWRGARRDLRDAWRHIPAWADVRA
jgi:predicted metal-dependent hydrolase